MYKKDVFRIFFFTLLIESFKISKLFENIQTSLFREQEEIEITVQNVGEMCIIVSFFMFLQKSVTHSYCPPEALHISLISQHI